ncbi:nucleotidyltransferase domain-containing protein [methanotrophic endosymbiont of Bathymodiolus puteoserpentis (Logatchev)]|jgi:hypothetical protein|uniref:nucleotidyltransferase domain-containing protein n=1 Tax=methanotrophic endosymbiont of Bathymodiolus puteoserpentis (Logatchev) TaxID=343235 RepID=UPI0013C9C2F9|nr:nucleotidyltransferase family protein [methanotrophic endosymbiont of Bathymodiolus puteoserpentis (Logatchev)]SHE23682.1 hypothetical protein BPUTEOMOX_1726 [methanotrophic endosymbiont of Bathymodiolus puteoserpentis (Logatchev)]
MTIPANHVKKILINCLCFPETVKELTVSEWELLIRCARHCKLLAYLRWKLDSCGLIASVPAQVLTHFTAAQRIVDYRNRLAMWELNRIRRALYAKDVEVLVLKGGAYQLLQIPFAQSRLLADIDILVKKSDIHTVETCLQQQGWQTAKLDEYDQQYYRTWMHEVPPLRHQERFIEVDLHHTILPLSSRLQPSPELLIEDSIVVENIAYKVFSPVDMILHSSVHLFYDAELNGADFRDLVDLKELIAYFQPQQEFFFEILLDRAKQLTLQRPLYYTLYFIHNLLDAPIPEEYIEKNIGKPSWLTRKLMCYLVPLALIPEHPDFPRKKVALARWLLYVRSHFLRMPFYLLIPHLLRKSRMRMAGKEMH